MRANDQCFDKKVHQLAALIRFNGCVGVYADLRLDSTRNVAQTEFLSDQREIRRVDGSVHHDKKISSTCCTNSFHPHYNIYICIRRNPQLIE